MNNIDIKNAHYWDYVCGTEFAKKIANIRDVSVNSIHIFDQAYMDFYPYLRGYIPDDIYGKKVLEIGLGFGTLGSLLLSMGANYYGMDIAKNPVRLMQYRLSLAGKNEKRAFTGSVLDIPFAENSCDYVFSIGCIHHTGKIQLAVNEIHRVLRPGGKVIVSVYYRYSTQQILIAPLIRLLRENPTERLKARYDSDYKGKPPPYTEYLSRHQVKKLFGTFSEVKIDVQNFHGIKNKLYRSMRRFCLKNIARIVGLDLYISAKKADLPF